MPQLIVSNSENVTIAATGDRKDEPIGTGDDLAVLDIDTVPDDVAEYARVRLGETEENRTKLLAELEDMIYGNRRNYNNNNRLYYK